MLYTGLIVASTTLTTSAQGKMDSATSPWSFHFQQTIIGHYHPEFHALYEGQNSQYSGKQTAYSLTTTLFLGHNLWKGAAAYLNPEVSGGAGLGRTLGVAGFPNGETYRVGDPAPTFYIARAYLTQYINLGNDTALDRLDDDINQTAMKAPRHYLSLTAGKYCLADFYDGNSYSHDPRTQFFNWSLMSAGAWDYPANTRGYTYAVTAAYGRPNWRVLGGAAMMPEVANGPFMDMKFAKANGLQLEIDHDYKLAGQAGTIRLIGFHNTAHMGSYRETLADTAAYHNSITLNERYGRNKYGFILNLEQSLSDASGIFARLSWNDGNNETYVFTEIDRSASLGYVTDGRRWRRKEDVFGLAAVVNGLAAPHRDYLAAGGFGFIIGDGKLNYAPEYILEAYYSIQLSKWFWLSPDYQFVMNPAYNQDRGPINFYGLRGHIQL